MAFTINNPSMAKESANSLITNSNSTDAYIEILSEIVATLDLNWGTSQTDAQYFKTRLQSEINFLTKSKQYNTEFANGIINYVELMEMASNATVNNTSSGI